MGVMEEVGKQYAEILGIIEQAILDGLNLQEEPLAREVAAKGAAMIVVRMAQKGYTWEKAE